MVWVLLVGAIAGVLTLFVILRKGWRGTWITVLLGIGGSLLGAFVGHLFGFSDPAVACSVGALITLWSCILFKRSTARGYDRDGARTGQLSISLRTSSATAPPANLRSDASPPPQIDHQVSAGGDIFISYASADRPTAQALAKALQTEGRSVWWDRAIPPGKSFDEVIEAALDAAKCVIVLWSRTSVTSDWVKVEAAEAARRRILIPALIAQVTIPLEFRRLQAADLTDWPASGPSQGFQSLIGSIADTIGKPKASGAEHSAI